MPSAELLTQNYFALFGYDEGDDITRDDLSARYLRLQRQFHPDRFAGHTDYERRLALSIAARINDAYAALKKPLSRAIYRLSLRGFDVLAEDNTAMPPDFLEKQMEWREAVSERASDAEAMRALAGEVDGEREAIAAATLTALSESRNEDAREAARQWVYLEKLWAEIKGKKG